MSMESDTTVPDLTCETYDPLLPDSDDDPENYPTFEDYYNDLSSDSDDESRLYTKADAIYRKLGPYDALPLPINSYLAGGSRIRPLPLTKRNRPFLKKLSVIALLYHQERSHASFEFHDLVKCTYWSDFSTPRRRSFGGEREPTEYYITFEAKAKGDLSNSPDVATVTFQAKVLVREEVKDKSPVVKQCRIKTMKQPAAQIQFKVKPKKKLKLRSNQRRRQK